MRPSSPPPSPWLQDIAARYHTTLSVYVHHLANGEVLQTNDDQPMRSAGLARLFVLYEAFSQVQEGRLSGADTVAMSEQAATQEPTAEWPIGTHTTVDCALRAMTTIGSSAATAMLLDRLGGKQGVTASLRSHGYTSTDLTTASAFTTAHDVGRLLDDIASDQAVSPQASAAMRRLLLAQRDNDFVPQPLPLSVSVAHQVGKSARLRHDAGIVYARSGSYVIVAMVDGGDSEMEARTAILDVSRSVFTRFQPGELTTYRGLVPQLAREVLQVRDERWDLAAISDPPAMTVPLQEAGVNVARGAEDSVVLDAMLPDLRALQEAASRDGAPLWVTAAYRGPALEDEVMNKNTKMPSCPVDFPPRSRPLRGEAYASVVGQEPLAAPFSPAVSQHWLGTTVAVSNSPDGPPRDEYSWQDPTARWLRDHAWDYSFILALPESELGRRLGYEPWKLRWVGRDMATQVRATLESRDYPTSVTAALLGAESDLANQTAVLR